MTSQLFGQRQALVQANMELEARRQFGEIVLAGVSTGIMVLDKDLCITLINPSGLNMFATSNANFIGKPYNSFFRETKHLLDHLLISDNKEIQKEIAVVRNNIRRNFLVKIATELFKDFDGNLSIQGYIVTFDDITDLLAAQWTEVARRVAHEIKNPLTPIKLAAERLRKKYVTQVKEPEVLERYTNTVIRHVDDINSIVEEFSNFVRMPKTLPIRINIAKLVHDIFLSHQCLSKSIGYSCNIPSAPVVVECDVGQITRLLNNIIKNAEEAIDSSQAGKAVRGNIHIDLVSDDTNVIVTITDNGKGFAEDILERATEPYVTTRSKGTGLGLAIVEKIVQEHNGSLTLANNTDGVGAHVKVELPLAC
jgi:two-component system nitrogen regulation sensor histidine kinase NtrY